MAATYKDNRFHIEANPDELQTWELIAIEQASIEKICLVLCRYVHNGNGQVDKDLPIKQPFRKMSTEQMNALMDGKGFEWLEELPMAQLRDVAQTFIQGATETLEKKA